MVFVASELQASVVPHHTFISDTLELCTVEVYIGHNNNKEKLFISGAYRPPSAPLAGLSGMLEGVLSPYTNSSLILTGDFNIDLINEEQSYDLSNLLPSFNFLPLITIPTRITDHSAKCLDHIWTNDNSFMFSGSIINDITDHYPIFEIYNKSSNKEIITLTYRNRSDNNINDFVHNVSLMCNEYFNLCYDMTVDQRTDFFLGRLWTLYNRHIEFLKTYYSIISLALGRDTTDAIIRLTDDYTNVLDKRLYTHFSTLPKHLTLLIKTLC